MNDNRMGTLYYWFLISKFARTLGNLVNLFTNDRIWNVFGDSMTFFVLLLSFGLSLGIDSFKFL